MKNELFQIGEIARLFHVSVSTLRHYDRIGLLSPEYTDPDSGYRYYSTRQFECLNTIRYLRELDIPLEQIGQFIENRQIDGICELLLQQKEEVRRRRKQLARIETKIDNRLAQIAAAASATLDAITVERKPPRRIAFLKRSFTLRSPLDLELYIRELEQDEEGTTIFLGKVGIGLSREALEGRRYDLYEGVFLILDDEDDHVGHTTLLPEELCAVVRFRGSHERAAEYYDILMQYLAEHGYQVAGFSKEVTMIDFGLTNDTSQFVTEIQIPIRPAGEGSVD